MTLSREELAIVFASLNTVKDGSARKFAFVDLGLMSGLSKKLRVHVKDGKLIEESYELDLTTEEKVKIMECAKEHEWAHADAEFVLSLEEKLK